MKKYIFIFLLLINPVKILVGQNANCALFMDDLKKGDTLKISIAFFVERNEFKEQISVFIDETNNYQAIMNSNEIKNKLITLNPEKIETIRTFESAIRNQNLENNIPIFINSQAEYSISYMNATITYNSRLKFYSFINLFDKFHDWQD